VSPWPCTGALSSKALAAAQQQQQQQLQQQCRSAGADSVTDSAGAAVARLQRGISSKSMQRPGSAPAAARSPSKVELPAASSSSSSAAAAAEPASMMRSVSCKRQPGLTLDLASIQAVSSSCSSSVASHQQPASRQPAASAASTPSSLRSAKSPARLYADLAASAGLAGHSSGSSSCLSSCRSPGVAAAPWAWGDEASTPTGGSCIELL
jgi:hypothetical protein